MQSSNHNKQQIRTLYEICLNERKYELLSNIVSADYTGPSGERGADGLAATVQPLINAFPNIRWTIEELLADGDKVVVRWNWTGTHSGDFRGYKASGNAVSNHAIAIYQFRDGKVIHAILESDRLGFLTQIGAIPEALLPTPPSKK